MKKKFLITFCYKVLLHVQVFDTKIMKSIASSDAFSLKSIKVIKKKNRYYQLKYTRFLILKSP